MVNYLRYNGPHFNKKLCEFAASNMKKKVGSSMVRITPYTKDAVEKLLQIHKVILNGGQLYDDVFVANMCKSNFYGSSIQDELHLAKYIKDVLDDDDAYDGIVFNSWYADMCRKGIIIDWDAMI